MTHDDLLDVMSDGKHSKHLELAAMYLPAPYHAVYEQVYLKNFAEQQAAMQKLLMEKYGEGSETPSLSVQARLSAAIPALNDMMVHCPACGSLGPVGKTIPHMNDSHRFTREKIADWLDGLDRDADLTFRLPEEVGA